MRWAGFLLALMVTAVAGSPDPALTDDWVTSLLFPDGTVPDLAFRPIPATRASEPTSDCPATCPTSGIVQKNEEAEWRLGRNVIPSVYKISLDVEVEKFLFNGSVQIDIDVRNATDQITLHVDALNLTTSTAYVSKSIGNAVYARVKNITQDKKHQTVTLNLDKALEARKKYRLYLDFDGVIRSDLHGFYRSSYKVGSETRWLATTQFEPTHARRAFPCFDEPNLKAVFYISITHDKKYRAISNMPIEESKLVGTNRVTDTFEPTEPMSTYLVAYIISDFKNYSANNPRSNIWATEEFIKDAESTQKYALKTLESMEKYSGIDFALPKMDHAGIPNFAAGAMENWGLITYRDYLLIKRNNTSTPTTQGIATVIAHEMAHQWFGDLVTLDWWSATWLNEGFATFFENYVTEEITNGKWALWDQFISNKFQVALQLDGVSKTSKPMTSNVSTPDEIAAKFDQITYGKGGCILRMFSEILKAENFRTGLQRYLRQREYKNAKPQDLFEQLKLVSVETSALPKEIDFTAFAKSWTEQDGVPVVTAIRNYETGEVSLTQKRFYAVPPSCQCDYNRRWWVPLSWNFRNRANTRPDDFKVESWLRGDVANETLTIKPGVATRDWFMLNVRSVGYFRVNYDTRNWILLTSALREAPANFSVANRAQILNDAHALASADELDFPIALAPLKLLINETDTAVWLSGIKIITQLYDNVGSTPAYPLFEEFARSLLNVTYAFVTLSVSYNEPHLKSLLRATIVPYSCLFGVPLCLKDATDKLAYHKDDVSILHPDVATATICGGIKAGKDEYFWTVRNQAKSVTGNDVKNYIVAALVCTSNNRILRQHLDDAVKPDSDFPKSHVGPAIQVVVTAPTKFPVAFEFLRDNLDKIIAKIGKVETRKIVVVFIKKIRTKSDHKEVGDWLKKHLDKFNEKEKLWEEWKNAEAGTLWNTNHLLDVTGWLATELGRPIPPGIPARPGTNSSVKVHSSSLLLAVVLSIITIFMKSHKEIL